MQRSKYGQWAKNPEPDILPLRHSYVQPAHILVTTFANFPQKLKSKGNGTSDD